MAGRRCRELRGGRDNHVRATRQTQPGRHAAQGRPRAAVGPRPLRRRSAGCGRHACRPTSSARRMPMPRSCASMRRARWRMTASGPSSPAKRSASSPTRSSPRSRRRCGNGRWPSSACAMSASRWRWSSPKAATSPRMRPNWWRSTTRRLPAVIDPVAACASDRAAHPSRSRDQRSFGARHFTYGEPEAAFARADRRIAMTVPFHRLSFTPIECYVVVAQHNPAENSYDVHGEFPGTVFACIR